jgi:hypothetical protein
MTILVPIALLTRGQLSATAGSLPKIKGPVTLHNDNDTINCKHAIIGKKNCVSVHTTTKMIKLSLDDYDNDFKMAHLNDFFQPDDNDTFLTNQRAYTSYRIV